ncbi:hypothetical protein HMPREF6745_1589 [Prevotella sp. oral taxon 472 str. F0295]|nr:hypothetical protein HMPREF6745_1589 [Prevotella sp. oral taxon 472 str. F0295]
MLKKVKASIYNNVYAKVLFTFARQMVCMTSRCANYCNMHRTK